MAEAPNSFKDPYWSDLAGSVEQKLELPKGLLVAIVTRGERSNNDQVSEANARTPFQIIPATRKSAIEKYGIDPYLSPENAAEVAGNLLKDSLQRNGGDAKLAVAEYHGGTDRANWGPRTKAYVQRVTGSFPDFSPAGATGAPASAQTTAPEGQSTFDRVSAQMAAPSPTAIGKVFAAYQAGQMPAADAKQFEADVKAGHIMLPPGAALKTAAAPAAAPGNVLPASVVEAYVDGRMGEQDRAQLRADVESGAVKLPDGLKLGAAQAAPSAANLGAGATAVPIVGNVANAETLAQVGTGLAGQAVGGIAALGTMAGNALGLTDANPVDVLGKVAGAMTYEPRTALGQQVAGQAAVPFEKLAEGADVVGGKVADVTGSPALGAAANTAIQIGAPAILGKVGGGVIGKVRDLRAAGAAPDPLAVAAATPPTAPIADAAAAARAATPGTMGSVGSAGTDLAVQRAARAADLPVPIELTKGQATRNHEQIRFEQETAKGNQGGALREHAAEQNARVSQNFDAFIDATGAEATDLIGVGRKVTDEIVKKAAKDKTEIRVAYKNAEKAGEMEAPVATDAVVQALNDSRSAESTAPVVRAARDELVRLGGATLGEDGLLVPSELKLKDMEQVRKFVNKTTGIDPTNQAFGADIKAAIDASTEGTGGTLYSQARALRRRYAQQYEDHSLIADLIANRKTKADRQVPLEDVFRRSVLNGSREDVGYLRRVLQTAGPEGHQAWREIQGATMRHIRDAALGNVATDIRGNPIVSAAKLNNAVKSFDADGKLDFIFGKRGAQQVRDLNDIAKTVYTMPPGTVNTSNTASVLLAALAEAGAWGGSTGLPVPVLTGLRQLSGYVKDRRIQKRVTEALAQARSRPAPRPASTLH